jgi:BclB C-terminal domain-containing protein
LTALVGNSSSVSGVSVTGGIIDTTSTNNYAFMMPRDGTITSIAAYFSTSNALPLVGSTVTITAQLYSSSADNVLTPIPGAYVTLNPQLYGTVVTGTYIYGTNSVLSIPVTAGTRLLLVYSATVVSGFDIATQVSGYASAGVGID